MISAEEKAMAKEKVCMVTGAAGTVGQHLLTHLVSQGHKVLAIGETADSFTPEVLNNRRIKVTTALPISSEQLKKHDIQFCFGDMGDISFWASVFAAADKGNVEIEFLFHLSANALIQKHSPAAYHPEYGAAVNLLEVARAYWQSHKNTFKGLFYAADTGKKTSKQIEQLIKKIREKDGFPAVVYQTSPVAMIGSGYNGNTSFSALYRVLSPFKSPTNQLAWKKEADDELSYIAGLKRAADKVLSQVKENKPLDLD